MNNDPLISVITPTYNRASYLPETIESVLSQNYRNLEHIIIDDGSSDTTRNLVNAYLDKGKIRYFYQKNSGQSIARNKGLKEAKGEFVCFLDSDDRWLPNKLRKQLNAFLVNPDVDIVYGDYIFIDEQGNEISHNNMSRYSGNITKPLLKDNFVSMNTTMTRTTKLKAISGFNENIEVADDYDLWLRLSVESRFLYIPELLAEYRIMNKQLSSNKSKRFASNEKTLLSFFDSNPNLLNPEERKDALNFFYTRATRHFSHEGNWDEEKKYLIKAFQNNALSRRNYRVLLRCIINKIKLSHTKTNKK